MTGKFKVIESELCAARHNKLTQEFPRLIERLDGLYWKLEHIGISILKNHDCQHIGKNVYMLQLSSWAPGGLPSISILFRLEEKEETIYIESSKVFKPTR